MALAEAFFRPTLPNIWGLIVAVAVGALVVYLQAWRVDIPVKYQKHRAQQGKGEMLLLSFFLLTF